ncbi:2-amino-4-hydroxy-6-hydroxymethyldihydropteridine diphosphokinase [Alkalimarinus sediminis]|uniref:2-amino-4-hydroxy-6-hydroxymethyldihydropteridine pyrophosphokinase n=1 Tax=Alkalimarinus sediminis TaxID=1632866 RepID=A0A9E8HJ79_9ALTE|nr:2-amino-4-hydroxy-6-hydroxymethyldihydropteridine diphosphokinase [Alkalimarinus sediminis]UZW75355.1 2-amino-4-hydroxy-6-hydroxymethyldihydropteridine diphosphokinase [Alkalimarinus sediminis]
MTKSTNTVYIGLGSNLNEPAKQLETALRTLAELPNCELIRHSSFYCSKPVGPQDQPDFVNAAAQISTTLSPESLLKQLQLIEQGQGRIKKRHWGERTIDLDILLFNSDLIDLPELSIPHKEIGNRDFVLKPLLELDANLALPDGTSLHSLLQQCPDNRLQLHSSQC